MKASLGSPTSLYHFRLCYSGPVSVLRTLALSKFGVSQILVNCCLSVKGPFFQGESGRMEDGFTMCVLISPLSIVANHGP